MDTTPIKDLADSHVHLQWHVYALTLLVGLRHLGALISSVRNGGGAVNIVKTFFYGENLPKDMGKEHQAKLEASRHPFEHPKFHHKHHK